MMVKFGVFVSILGAVVFLASVQASGIQYRISETAGEVTGTPEWIAIWHVVGLIVTTIGVVVFVVGVIREGRQRGDAGTTVVA